MTLVRGHAAKVRVALRRLHPCTSRQIAEAVGLTRIQTSDSLQWLVKNGLARSTGRGRQIRLWHAVQPQPQPQGVSHAESHQPQR